jgi:hypothetical protein
MVDYIELVSQLELLLPWGSSSGVYTATASLLAAAPSADSESGRLEPLGSPPPVLTALQPARSHPVAEEGRLPLLTQASPLRLELRRHSSRTLCLRVMAILRGPQYITGYRSLCLPACLYALLVTARNICYRNLCGCFSKYQNQRPR